ncbi:hypothetical protein PYCC9005_003145 [Savitreella phatthalungensis]
MADTAASQQREQAFAKEVSRLESFIREKGPDKTYLIDGDRDDDRSTICRRGGAGMITKSPQDDPLKVPISAVGKDLANRHSASLECLKLAMASTKLFSEMQRLGYFCILPQGNITTTQSSPFPSPVCPAV